MNPLMKVVVLSFAVLAFGLDVYERDSCAIANYEKLAETSSDFSSMRDPYGRSLGSFGKNSLGLKNGRAEDLRRSKVLRQLRRQPKNRKQARYFYETSGMGS